MPGRARAGDGTKMLAHAVLRVAAWRKDLVFEPSLTVEDSIERMFGWLMFGWLKTIKRGCSGTTTVAGSILASHLIHLRQSRPGTKVACRI